MFQARVAHFGFSEIRKRAVLADVPHVPQTGMRVPKKTGITVPKPERGHKKWYDGTKNRTEGTGNGTTVPKPESRAHSPKTALYKMTLLFPLESQDFHFLLQDPWTLELILKPREA